MSDEEIKAFERRWQAHKKDDKKQQQREHEQPRRGMSVLGADQRPVHPSERERELPPVPQRDARYMQMPNPAQPAMPREQERGQDRNRGPKKESVGREVALGILPVAKVLAGIAFIIYNIASIAILSPNDLFIFVDNRSLAQIFGLILGLAFVIGQAVTGEYRGNPTKKKIYWFLVGVSTIAYGVRFMVPIMEQISEKLPLAPMIMSGVLAWFIMDVLYEMNTMVSLIAGAIISGFLFWISLTFTDPLVSMGITWVFSGIASFTIDRSGEDLLLGRRRKGLF